MKDTHKHILVIRLSAMGDVAMTAVVIKALIAQHPNVKVTVLSRAFLEPLFKDLPNVNFYNADTTGKHKGLKGIYTLYRELKTLHIDAVADLHNVMRSKILSLFFSGTKTATLDKGRAEKKALTRAKNKVFKQLKTTHERYADVFKALGYSIDLSKVEFSKPKKLTTNLQNIVGELSEPTRLIGIAPFAQHAAKTYPIDLMDEVIEKLSVKANRKIVLFGGGAKETAILSALADKYASVILICLAGKVKLREELLLISNLNCMLSMDSGNGHFAALYGVPVVTIWGATHPYAGFAPFGQDINNTVTPDLNKFPLLPTSIYGNKLVEGYENVMRTISPNTILTKINQTLEN